MHTLEQCWGSVAFWCGSRSGPDPEARKHADPAPQLCFKEVQLLLITYGTVHIYFKKLKTFKRFIAILYGKGISNFSAISFGSAFFN